MKHALLVTSVASMIKQFNMGNIKLLQDLGYRVTVATNFTAPGNIPLEVSEKLFLELESIEVLPIDIPFHRFPCHLNNLKAYKKIKVVIDYNDFDLIHCQSPIGGALTRLAAHKARKRGTKVLYTAHGFHFYKGATIKNWLLFYPLEKFLSTFTDILITINHEDCQLAKKSFQTNQIEYVPGIGVNLEYTNNISINRDDKIKELGISNNNFIMISVGELNLNKNHEVVIKALAQLNNKSIHYIICGFGKQKDDLEKLSENLGVKNQVHFLGYRSDVFELLKAADVFVFPSLREGLPVSLMEAMACGLPVISSDIRGNRDLIDNEYGGYLMKNNDYLEYALSIEKLLNDPTNRLKMRNYNLSKIQKFSTELVSKKMYKIYSSIAVNGKNSL